MILPSEPTFWTTYSRGKRPKLRVEIIPKNDDQWWMEVHLLNGQSSFIPSFEDWYVMLRVLAMCEYRKYRHRVADPVDMIRRFFLRCLDDDSFWPEVRDEFGIPRDEE